MDVRLDEIEIHQLMDDPESFAKEKYGETSVVYYDDKDKCMIITNNEYRYIIEFVSRDEDFGFIFESSHFLLNRYYKPSVSPLKK